MNIGGSILFAGMTGAAVTDTVAIGNIMIPAMKKEGYSSDYSAAVTAASSIIGPVIPPSITMIVYANITGLSVVALFLGGLFPGLLMGLLMLVVSAVISVKRQYPRRESKATLREIGKSIKDAILALFVPVIIFGVIFSGIATVTEAAAVAAGVHLCRRRIHNAHNPVQGPHSRGFVHGQTDRRHLFASVHGPYLWLVHYPNGPARYRQQIDAWIFANAFNPLADA